VKSGRAKETEGTVARRLRQKNSVASVEVKIRQSDFELVEIDPDHLKASAFNMLFMIWRRESLAEPFRRSVALVEQLAKKSKSQIGVCQLVEPEAIAPDAAARAAFTEI
jgi:hypothetical protein